MSLVTAAECALMLTDPSPPRPMAPGSGLRGLGVKSLAAHPSDLGIYLFEIVFSCPICPRAGSMLARVFFGPPGVAVKSGSDGLDQFASAGHLLLRTVNRAGCGLARALFPLG